MQRNFQSSYRPRRDADSHAADVVPQVTMEVDIPRALAGRIIGKNGVTVHRIERDTGARIHVEGAKGQSERTYVVAKGHIQQVDNVFKEVQLEVAKFDRTIAEQLKRTLKDVVTETVDRPERGGNTMSSWERQNAAQWNPKDMTAHVTVEALKPTFRSLIGRRGENVNAIRRETRAEISIEDQKQVSETQRAFIAGPIEDVLRATRKVKESLQAYDPVRDRTARRHSMNVMDLKIIKAEAEIKIVDLATALLIGKNGQNVKRIKRETNIEYIYIEEDKATKKRDLVRICGHVAPVLEAVEQVRNSLKNYSPDAAIHGLSVETTEDIQSAHPRTRFAVRPPERSRPPSTLAKTSTTARSRSPSLNPLTQPSDTPEVYTILDGSGKRVECVREADGRFRPISGNHQQQYNPPLNLSTPPGFEGHLAESANEKDDTMRRGYDTKSTCLFSKSCPFDDWSQSKSKQDKWP